jgi:hypothetical protein
VVQPKKITLVLGGQTFRSLTAAQKATARILWKYKPPEYLSDKDVAFVRDMLRFHPIKEKADLVVKSVFVDFDSYNSPHHRSQSFIIVTPDNRYVRISYRDCLTNWRTHTYEKEKVITALRSAYFKDKPYSRGKEVHHEGKSFQEILQGFWDEYHLSPMDILISQRPKGGWVINDQQVFDLWFNWHHKEAKLVRLEKEEHLRTRYKSRNEDKKNQRKGDMSLEDFIK